MESQEELRGTDLCLADENPRWNPNHTIQFIKSCFFPTNQPASTSLKHSFWLISLTFPSFSGVVRAPGNLSLSSLLAPNQWGIEWEPECCLRKEKLQNHKLQKIVTAKNRKEHTISPGLLKSNCAFHRSLDNSGLFGNFLTHTTQKTILFHQRQWSQRVCVIEKKEKTWVQDSPGAWYVWISFFLFYCAVSILRPKVCFQSPQRLPHKQRKPPII